MTDSTVTNNSSGSGGDSGDVINTSSTTTGDGGGVCAASAVIIAGNKFLSCHAGTAGSAGIYIGDNSDSYQGSDGSDGGGSELYIRSGMATADNNWWGDDVPPTSDMTNAAVSKWLVLSMDAPAAVTKDVPVQITVTLQINNDGEVVDNVYGGLTASISAFTGTVPGSAALVGGTATFTYTAIALGTDRVTAALDNDVVTVDIDVSEISIEQDSFAFALGIYKEAELTAVGTLGTMTWSATGLPDGLSLDTDMGVISGTPSQTGTYTVKTRLTDTRTDFSLTYEKDITVYVFDATGNGAYLVTPAADEAYIAGMTDGFIPTMTVSDGVSGFTYFTADISNVLGHSGEETAVFVHMRNGMQVGIMGYKGDFDGGGAACACFNVRADDVVRVYLVDELTNGATDNPTVL